MPANPRLNTPLGRKAKRITQDSWGVLVRAIEVSSIKPITLAEKTGLTVASVRKIIKRKTPPMLTTYILLCLAVNENPGELLLSAVEGEDNDR